MSFPYDDTHIINILHSFPGVDWHFRTFPDVVVVSEKKVRQIFGYVKKKA
jgi:hypothetical protein